MERQISCVPRQVANLAPSQDFDVDPIGWGPVHHPVPTARSRSRACLRASASTVSTARPCHLLACGPMAFKWREEQKKPRHEAGAGGCISQEEEKDTEGDVGWNVGISPPLSSPRAVAERPASKAGLRLLFVCAFSPRCVESAWLYLVTRRDGPSGQPSTHWRRRRGRWHRPGSRLAWSPSGTGRTRRSSRQRST